ncbi:hypothetical protein ACEQ8H_000824 [Pleosporales sp. CAS-2024a]
MARKRKAPDIHARMASKRVTRSQTLRERIAQKNQQVSPLLRLPPEIRNMVYRYVFQGMEWAMRICEGEIRARDENPALLKVCRQINAETALLPYCLGTFNFEDIYQACDVAFFEARSAAQLGAIRSISYDDMPIYYDQLYRYMRKLPKSLPSLSELRFQFGWCNQMRIDLEKGQGLVLGPRYQGQQYERDVVQTAIEITWPEKNFLFQHKYDGSIEGI